MSDNLTARRRIYVVRIECPDERSYDLMYRAAEVAIYRLWDKPPVFLSGGMENQHEQ